MDGKCIKIHCQGYGGSYGEVIEYDVVKDLYKLEFAVGGEVRFMTFEDVLSVLHKSWSDLLVNCKILKIEIVPMQMRVYKSCCHPVVAMILVIYVDNNGIRHNCEELLQEFEKPVKQDGRINLQRREELD